MRRFLEFSMRIYLLCSYVHSNCRRHHHQQADKMCAQQSSKKSKKKCVKLLTVLSIYFSSVSCANLNFSVAFVCLRSATCRVRVNERLKRVYQHYHHPLSETVTRPAPYSVFVCLSTTLLYYIRKKTENLPQELTYKLYISVRKVRWGRELY